MPVTTLNTAFWWISGSNPATNKVINYMTWKRTTKQIVWEFFWLREEAIYDDNWENIIDFINDFTDLDALAKKWVKYNDRFLELWITEQDFKNLFKKWLPNLDDNKTKNGEWKSSNTWTATSSKTE